MPQSAPHWPPQPASRPPESALKPRVQAPPASTLLAFTGWVAARSSDFDRALGADCCGSPSSPGHGFASSQSADLGDRATIGCLQMTGRFTPEFRS